MSETGSYDSTRITEYICYIANDSMRDLLMSHVTALKVTTPILQDYILHFKALNSESKFDVNALTVSLLNKGYEKEEIEEVVTRSNDVIGIQDESSLKVLLADFESFKTKSLVNDNLLRLHLNELTHAQFVYQMSLLSEDKITYFPLEDLSETNDPHGDLMNEMNDSSDYKLKSMFNVINESLAFDAYLKGMLVQVAAAPGVGKTMFMMCEAVNFLKTGKKVLWVALGDMMKIDFYIRMSAIYHNVPLDDVTKDVNQYYTEEFRDLLKNFKVSILSAGEIDGDGLASNIKTISRSFEYDATFIDYDANVKATEGMSMYDQGGHVYRLLNGIARFKEHKSLVFVGSQIKPMYWSEEEVPEEASAESSQKQANIDMMITIGAKPDNKGKQIGTINIPKQRRGKKCKAKYMLSDSGIFKEITMATYNQES